MADAGNPNPPLFEATVDLEASSIQAGEVTVAGLETGTVSLWWESDQAPHGGSDSVARQIEQSGDSRGATLRFDLAEEPGWRGRIRRVRVMADRRERDRIEIRGVSLLARHGAASSSDAWRRRSFRFALGNDQRRAFAAVPGDPLRHTLKLDKSATLQFDYGIEGGVRTEVRFRVVGRTERGDFVRVFDQTLDGRSGDPPTWHRAFVDLSPLGTGEVELRFEVETADGFDPAAGFALWGDPLITRLTDAPVRPNLVLIVADTLRADRLSVYGYPRTTTPNLQRFLARHAALFRTAVAAAPSTLPAHASIFTGLDPPRHGANGAPAAADLKTLAEILRAEGYKTLAVTGGGFLHPFYGLDQGFDIYRHWRWGSQREQELPSSVDWSLERLDRIPEPFFLFFHTYETHSPYRARSPYFQTWSGMPTPEGMLYPIPRESSKEEGFLYRLPARYEQRGTDVSAGAVGGGDARLASELYDSSVAFLDAQIGRLIERLEGDGLLARTEVVFTSDHGESLGEHGLAGHGTLYEENLLVPLLVGGSGRAGGRRIERQVRAVDLLPTLLELLSIPSAARYDGRSLVPLLRGGAELSPLPALSYAGNSNRGLAIRFERGLKLVAQDTAWLPLAGRREAFDVRSVPDESTSRPLEATALAALSSWLEERIVPVWRGATLRWVSAGSGPVFVRLEGAGLSSTTVKLLGEQPASAELLEPGRVEATFAAGRSGYLLLAPEACRELEIEVRIADGPVLRLEHSDQGRSRAWRMVAGSWLAATGAESVGPLVEWSVRGAGGDQLGGERDRELVEQLRALGYIP